MGASMDYDKTTHPGIRCDGCGTEPIEGVRYKCGYVNRVLYLQLALYVQSALYLQSALYVQLVCFPPITGGGQCDGV